MLSKNNSSTDTQPDGSTPALIDRVLRDLTYFFDWWLSGLAIPWLRQSVVPIVISKNQAKGGNAIGRLELDQQGLMVFDDLTALQLERLASSERVYLFVPSDKVIVTKIDQAQRNLHALDIALESLPFARDEIVATVSDNQKQLYCVLKRDIDELMESTNSWSDSAGDVLDIGFSGIAFVGDSAWLSIDTDRPMSSDFREFKGRRFFLGLVASLLLMLGAMLIAIEFAQSQRADLQGQLNAFSSQESARPEDALQITSLLQALERPSSRSAKQTLAVLNALLESLEPDVEISQLILSANELLIDARADSASRFQLALSSSGKFDDLEFVAGISTDANSDKERFRLKIAVSQRNGDIGSKVREAVDE